MVKDVLIYLSIKVDSIEWVDIGLIWKIRYHVYRPMTDSRNINEVVTKKDRLYAIGNFVIKKTRFCFVRFSSSMFVMDMTFESGVAYFR